MNRLYAAALTSNSLEIRSCGCAEWAPPAFRPGTPPQRYLILSVTTCCSAVAPLSLNPASVLQHQLIVPKLSFVTPPPPSHFLFHVINGCVMWWQTGWTLTEYRRLVTVSAVRHVWSGYLSGFSRIRSSSSYDAFRVLTSGEQELLVRNDQCEREGSLHVPECKASTRTLLCSD